jgi:hypothetical protein
MRAFVLAAAAVVAAVVASVTAGDAGSDRVQRLVDRLGSGGFRDRESATRELDNVGEPALDALRKAAASTDPETRRRAADLVERINGRLSVARVLAPTSVQFDYKDKPLADAVADLGRQIGTTITLHEQSKFRGRTITAATPGPVPLWEAVELFCRKAELHEWDGLTPVPGLAAPQTPAQIQGMGGFNGQVVFLNRNGRSRPTGPPSTAVVLLDGPGGPLPTSHGGAVRVRVLPPNTPMPNTAVGADDLVLPLQVSAEPKLNWQAAADVRVDRAMDDAGRPLTATAVLPMMPVDEDELILVNGMVVQAPARRAGPVGVRVRRGDKPAKKIVELAGTVAAHVRLAEPLAVVDAPLKAAGQPIRGGHGVTLNIRSISRGESGEVTLSADVRMPPDVQLQQGVGALNMNGAVFAGQVVIQGGGAIRFGAGGPQPAGQALPSGTTEYQGLALEDAAGKRFTAPKGVVELSHLAQDGMTLRVTATFRPAEKTQEPARLVFTATRPATIDVPFTIKDVPLN